MPHRLTLRTALSITLAASAVTALVAARRRLAPQPTPGDRIAPDDANLLATEEESRHPYLHEERALDAEPTLVENPPAVQEWLHEPPHSR